jgi:L-iditol 2-dehydrogenase
MPMADLWRREVTVRTAYGSAPADSATALRLLAAGRVAVADLITHRLPLDEIVKGFQLVAAADKSVKVILQP